MEENNKNNEPLNKDFKVPKLRFSKYSNIWYTAKIGTLFSIEMCKRIFANQTSEMGEIPFYKIGTLGAIPNAYISRELFEVYKHKYHFPKIGEILISCSGTIGRCIQYDGKDAYFQDSNIVWIANDQSVIINDFLFYLIVRYDWNFLNTSTIKRLFTYDLCNLTIYYPKNKFEQKHIADTIKSIISKIENIEQKIKTLKKYKEDSYKKDSNY